MLLSANNIHIDTKTFKKLYLSLQFLGKMKIRRFLLSSASKKLAPISRLEKVCNHNGFIPPGSIPRAVLLLCDSYPAPFSNTHGRYEGFFSMRRSATPRKPSASERTTSLDESL